MSEGHTKAFEVIDRRLAALASLEEAIRYDESAWYWKKLREYAGALFERAPFRAGDRVRLTKTPVITEKDSWGWLPSKHFLVAGALGTVRYIDFRDGLFLAYIVWDEQSWIGFDKKVNPVEPDGRSLYCHWEGTIERVPVEQAGEDPAGGTQK